MTHVGEIHRTIIAIVLAEFVFVEEAMYGQGCIEGGTAMTLAQEETITIGIIDRFRGDAQFATI